MIPEAGRVAVTGAGGRLGRALIAALAGGPWEGLAWSRPDYDLDDPLAAARCLLRDRPDLVLHPAAWTDVDGCARDPALASRRNGRAVAELAAACASAGAGLVLVSTNEVFDGERADGRGYCEDDETNPRNAYGASKLEGEEAVRGSSVDPQRLWIVRTSWLYGPPGNDFPAKIVAAADRLPEGDPLPVVADEFGAPTHVADLADAMLRLVARTDGGTFHLANAGIASRLDWARSVLAARRPGRAVRPISRSEFTRASDPPPWGVLDGTRAGAAGVVLRDWREALRAALAG